MQKAGAGESGHGTRPLGKVAGALFWMRLKKDPACSDKTSVLAQAGGDNRHSLSRRGQRVAPQRPLNGWKHDIEARQTDPTPDDDPLGVEEGNRVGDAEPQHGAGVLQYPLGRGAATSGGPKDMIGADGVRAPAGQGKELGRVARTSGIPPCLRQRPPRRHGLETASLAA